MDLLNEINTVTVNNPEQDDQEDKPKYPPELEFSKWGSALLGLLGTHGDFALTVESNRKARDIDFDVEAAQQNGKLEADETFIPIRVIDTNIKNEMPPVVRYLITPARVGIFKNRANLKANYNSQEEAFTAYLKYPKWFIPVYQVLDGAKAHGVDAIEVCPCETNPGGFEFYAIGADNLILPDKTISIEASPVVGIKLPVTLNSFEKLSEKEGFNPEAIAAVTKTIKEATGTTKFDNIDIIKWYIKVKGQVFVAFYCEKYTTGWLADPRPFFVGVTKQVPELQAITNPDTGMPSFQTVMKSEPEIETQYPIFPIQHVLKENKIIRESLGRCILDLSNQEAQSSLVSSYVNGTHRATIVTPCVDGEVEPGIALEALDVKYESGKIWNRPLKYHAPPYPPNDILRGVSALDVRNKADQGQQSIAADNRVDSRKTAKEMEVVTEATAKLDSVAVTILSAWWGDVLNFCWRIVRARAIAGKIPFVPEQPESLSIDFLLLPAGDSDYLQREERIEKFNQFWPIIVNYPQLAATMFGDILKEVFPEKGTAYAELLMQSVSGNNFESVAKGLYQMLTALMENPSVQQLPEAQQILPMLKQMESTMSEQAPGQQQQPQPTQQ